MARHSPKRRRKSRKSASGHVSANVRHEVMQILADAKRKVSALHKGFSGRAARRK